MRKVAHLFFGLKWFGLFFLNIYEMGRIRHCIIHQGCKAWMFMNVYLAATSWDQKGRKTGILTLKILEAETGCCVCTVQCEEITAVCAAWERQFILFSHCASFQSEDVISIRVILKIWKNDPHSTDTSLTLTWEKGKREKGKTATNRASGGGFDCSGATTANFKWKLSTFVSTAFSWGQKMTLDFYLVYFIAHLFCNLCSKSSWMSICDP